MLRSNPGTWGLVITSANPECAGTQANNIRRGILAAFRPAGTYRAVARGHQVWASYQPGHTNSTTETGRVTR